jgi:hypothetical protein
MDQEVAPRPSEAVSFKKTVTAERLELSNVSENRLTVLDLRHARHHLRRQVAHVSPSLGDEAGEILADQRALLIAGPLTIQRRDKELWALPNENRATPSAINVAPTVALCPAWLLTGFRRQERHYLSHGFSPERE